MWFYAKDGEQHGPVEAEDIRERLKSGDLSNGTLVWREGMAQWTALGEVLELREPVPASSDKEEIPASSESEGATVSAVPSSSDPYVAPAVTQLPQPAPQLVAPVQQNSMALVSLILGIISLVLCMGPVTGIPAIICGHIARKQFRELPTPQSGEGMATAGPDYGLHCDGAVDRVDRVLCRLLCSGAQFRVRYASSYFSCRTDRSALMNKGLVGLQAGKTKVTSGRRIVGQHP